VWRLGARSPAHHILTLDDAMQLVWSLVCYAPQIVILLLQGRSSS
jgi:hypothetical protein